MKIKVPGFFILAALFFVSCGGLSQSGDGSVTLDAGKVARYLGRSVEKSRSVNSAFNYRSSEEEMMSMFTYGMIIKVSTSGDYSESVEKRYTKSLEEVQSEEEMAASMQEFYGKATGDPITINGIPVGSKIRVNVKLTIGEILNEDLYRKHMSGNGMPKSYINMALEALKEEMEEGQVSVEGTSEPFVVRNGANRVTIKINDLPDDFEEEDNTTIVLFVQTNSGYDYYLTDKKNLNSVNLLNPIFQTSSYQSNYCFDAEGNVYIYGDGKLYTNNPDFPEAVIQEDEFDGKDYILIDKSENVLYMYEINEMTLNLYKYPDFLSSGDLDNRKSYFVNYSAGISGFMHQDLVIDDSVLYEFGVDYEQKYYILNVNLDIYDDGNVQSFDDSVEFNFSDFDLSNESTRETDMIYHNDAVYLLINESGNSSSVNTAISRGAVIKYDTSQGTLNYSGFANSRSVEIPLAAKYKKNGTEETDFYEDYDDETDKSTGTTIHNFPYTFSTPMNNLQAVFAGPQRFVAVKPKELVISDSGIAFYTDGNNAYKYKDVNRVVYLSLKDLAISTSKDVNALSFGSKPEPGAAKDSREMQGYYWDDTEGKFMRENSSYPTPYVTTPFVKEE